MQNNEQSASQIFNLLQIGIGSIIGIQSLCIQILSY